MLDKWAADKIGDFVFYQTLKLLFIEARLAGYPRPPTVLCNDKISVDSARSLATPDGADIAVNFVMIKYLITFGVSGNTQG